MTVSAEVWQARAAMCELLALSLRYPEDTVLSEAVASGEWYDAADEIAGALGLAWSADKVVAADAPTEGAAAPLDPAELQRDLRVEATRLFVGAPEPACSPYEGVWRAADDGVQALLFVNPHSMEVERFCKACGLGRPEGTNEPLDAVATELELLEYLALRAAVDAAEIEPAASDELSAGEVAGREDGGEESESVGEESEGDTLATVEPDAEIEDGALPADEPDAEIEDEDDGEEPGDVVASADLPGGSPAAAWDQFMAEHAIVWMPRFAEAVAEQSRVSFYRQVAGLLGAFIR